MKTIEICRDRDSRRLRFLVREDHKLVANELSTQTELRKLRAASTARNRCSPS